MTRIKKNYRTVGKVWIERASNAAGFSSHRMSNLPRPTANTDSDGKPKALQRWSGCGSDASDIFGGSAGKFIWIQPASDSSQRSTPDALVSKSMRRRFDARPVDHRACAAPNVAWPQRSTFRVGDGWSMFEDVWSISSNFRLTASDSMLHYFPLQAAQSYSALRIAFPGRVSSLGNAMHF